MIYGYARISRPTQNIERQIRNINDYISFNRLEGKITIIKEIFTGTKQDRPEWIKLRRKLKAGDTIIFDSVSRMSRNAEEGYIEYEELYNHGINLVFLKERYIDTDTYRNALSQQIQTTGNEIADAYISATNKVLLILAEQQIKLAFKQSQKEVEDLHNRTSEGLKTAKLNGKRIGRQQGETVTTKKSIEAKRIIQRHSADFGGSLNDRELIQMIGISRNSFYKYKKKLKEAIY